MTSSFSRLALVLLVAGFVTVQAQAQSSDKGPYGLQNAEIKITYEEYGEDIGYQSGPATVTLTSDYPIEGDQILLTLADGRRDYDLRLRRSRDDSFSARGDLPASTDIRSLRLGTGDEVGRDSFLMPQVKEQRDGTLSGTREGDESTLGITIIGSVETNDDGSTTIIICWFLIC